MIIQFKKLNKYNNNVSKKNNKASDNYKQTYPNINSMYFLSLRILS